MLDTAFGLLAGIFSALAYGSFAVPIKAKAVINAKVHPLIFQSYKSLMCFTLSWLVLIWADFRFTWWAVLAALIWVINGVLAIISIHLAGLGVAQTIWSCVSVFVSFAWGKLLFHEPMKNAALSVVGLSLMILGMLGLGWTASRFEMKRRYRDEPKAAAVAVMDEIFAASLEPEDELDEVRGSSKKGGADEEQQTLLGETVGSNGSIMPGRKDGVDSQPEDVEAMGSSLKASSQEAGPALQRTVSLREPLWWERNKFLLGVVGGVIIGVLAGSMMVCLKLSPPDRQGDQYTLSFGIGVAIVTVAALSVTAVLSLLFGRRPPSFHWRVAAGPACLAGVLWTIGNYLSIVAVDSLGMAVGWPIVQCSLIVSNSWALFWYREVDGARAIGEFFCCSVVILVGVAMLAWFGL